MLELKMKPAESLERPVSLGRPIRVMLGLIVALGGVFFMAISAILLFGDRSQMPHPMGALALGIFFAVIGAAFVFIGVRLVVLKSAAEPLFPPKVAMIVGAGTALVGLLAVISAVWVGPIKGVIAGILFFGAGLYVFRIAKAKLKGLV